MGSAGLTFLLFFLSRFQLPHYIIIFFPQLYMILADDLISIQKISTQKAPIIIQTILVIIAAVLVIALSFYARLRYGYFALAMAAAVIIASFIRNKSSFIITIITRAYAFAIIVCLFLNLSIIFHVSEMNLHFLNCKTRDEQLEKMALVAVGQLPAQK